MGGPRHHFSCAAHACFFGDTVEAGVSQLLHLCCNVLMVNRRWQRQIRMTHLDRHFARHFLNTELMRRLTLLPKDRHLLFVETRRLFHRPWLFPGANWLVKVDVQIAFKQLDTQLDTIQLPCCLTERECLVHDLLCILDRRHEAQTHQNRNCFSLPLDHRRWRSHRVL